MVACNGKQYGHATGNIIHHRRIILMLQRETKETPANRKYELQRETIHSRKVIQILQRETKETPANRKYEINGKVI